MEAGKTEVKPIGRVLGDWIVLVHGFDYREVDNDIYSHAVTVYVHTNTSSPSSRSLVAAH